jgi:ectoine hydroxylase-related dioxygenase (phytanoyl-CoA dioxygenase family)
VDYPYWALRPPYPTWNLAAHALWMLDDFTEDNGAIGIIPRSHRRDYPPDINPGEWPSDAVIATGAKGSVILAHGAYWHTARPNTSASTRSAVVVSYLRAFCMPHTDMRRQLAQLANPTADEQRLFRAEHFVSRS